MNNKHQPLPCFLFFSPQNKSFPKNKIVLGKVFFLTRLICFFDWLTCCIPCPIPTTPRLIPTSITPFHLGNSRVLIIIPIRFQKPPRLKRHHRKRSRATQDISCSGSKMQEIGSPTSPITAPVTKITIPMSPNVIIASVQVKPSFECYSESIPNPIPNLISCRKTYDFEKSFTLTKKKSFLL